MTGLWVVLPSLGQVLITDGLPRKHHDFVSFCELLLGQAHQDPRSTSFPFVWKHRDGYFVCVAGSWVSWRVVRRYSECVCEGVSG